MLFPKDAPLSMDVDGALILVHLPEVLDVVVDGEGGRGGSVLEASNGSESSRDDVEAAGDREGGPIGSCGEKNGKEVFVKSGSEDSESNCIGDADLSVTPAACADPSSLCSTYQGAQTSGDTLSRPAGCNTTGSLS